MTFSIVARDPRTGMLGIGTSSKALAAGALVPYIRPGVGAIASQSFTNPYLGIEGLTLIEQGLTAARALEKLIDSDRGRDLRQVAVVDHAGNTAAYTGAGCIDWAGAVEGGGYVCAGNILAGEGVVTAMARAYEASGDLPLAERLLVALEAGQEAGGDRRGRQSAGIQVFDAEDYPICDLRVDDHADPVGELRRVYEVYAREMAPFMQGTAKRDDYTPFWDAVLQVRDGIEASLKEEATAAKES
jgi:uncharacterized Ntn-hydrolase superfamily protein